MPSKLYYSSGNKQIVFADFAGDFAPTVVDLRSGTPTEVQLSLASLGSLAAHQSAKVDLDANGLIPTSIDVEAVLEFSAGVNPNSTVEFWWNPTASGTAGVGNKGGTSGTDSAYTGTAAGDIISSSKQLIYIGTFTTTADVTPQVQVASFGNFFPTQRYGSLVVSNRTAHAFHSNDVQMHVVFIPQYPEGLEP